MRMPSPADYQFAYPWLLLLLLAVPVLAWLRGRRGRAPAILFPTAFLVKDLGGRTRSAAGSLTPNLVLLSLVAAIIALARPQHILSTDEDKTEGIAICLCVDVSLSMLTEDYFVGGTPTNRLIAAKQVMRDFIKGRASDRIGIVAFAGNPYLPCPLTLDHDWLERNIDRVQTGITGDGTAIGSGLAAAAARLDIEKKVKSKVIVLLTDGANNSGRLSPQDAAKLGATLGIKIYAIAIGTSGEHVIPLPGGRMYNSGREEFDEPTLKEVARIGSGAYYRAQDSDALKNVFATIDSLERTEVIKRRVTEGEDLYPGFVVAAAALLGLGLLLGHTVLRTSPA
ncbi:MAG: Ca-activated chloride channel family protein [Verrucomicrobiaceae bacterium]|nr:Ca-activated chloride channel family protein [Verrucomicrobiaceae bacterium]